MSEADDKPEDAVAKMLADTMPLPEPGTDPLAYRAQMFLYKHLRYDEGTQKLTLTVAFNDLLVGFAREEAAGSPPERAQLPQRPESGGDDMEFALCLTRAELRFLFGILTEFPRRPPAVERKIQAVITMAGDAE